MATFIPATRLERDSMGDMPVPADALWGASTQRAVLNFPISGRPIPPSLIHALGALKSACARVNHGLEKLTHTQAQAIIGAADEVAAGKLDAHFVVDIYQTGSGTSSNMNANEVIANRASQRAGKPLGSHDPVHPNDHVNFGQSSNDAFPTAMHVAAVTQLLNELHPALEKLHASLDARAKEWDDVVKIGRTHLMDATPIRMGQVFSGYAQQALNAIERIELAVAALLPLAIGGTAVGTGINTDEEFGRRVTRALAERTGFNFSEAPNHFEAQAARDAWVEASGLLKVVAISLSKVANDIRLLGSGPRCGLFELMLPAVQPGSSIMPGKVNPVVCESVIQVAARVIGNDATIHTAALGGVGSILELNVAMPVMADALLESIHLLTHVTHVFVDKLLDGLQVNRARCEELIEQSLMLGTALVPALGYDAAAELAKEGFETGKTIRQLATEKKLLPPAELDRLLNPRAMTEPGGEGPAGG
ncbi:MAG: class II fumarate hydratase [Planctomycetota bacterium]|nr:class II fumarate hydratase [Planctomycetota bacterium]